MPLLSRRQLHHGKSCPYCNRAMDRNDYHLMPTLDHHPVPRSKGGRVTIVCCLLCNNRKGDMTAVEWESYMASNPSWWLVTRRERKQKRAAARTEKWGPRVAETDAALIQGRPSRSRIAAPPLEQTRKFLRQASLRALRKDEPIPVNYTDPKAQAAFEGAYKDRKWLLRVPDETFP